MPCNSRKKKKNKVHRMARETSSQESGCADHEAVVSDDAEELREQSNGRLNRRAISIRVDGLVGDEDEH